MNSSRTHGLAVIFAIPVLCLTMSTGAAPAASAQSGASRTLVLWDTLAPVGDKLAPESRSKWKAVPQDLLLLEKDPLKASSDPGYYGREYSFASDAVVETPTVATVFSCAKGCVTIYSKSSGKDEPPEAAAWKKIVDVCPVIPAAGPDSISGIELLRNADDQIVLQVAFSHPGSRSVAGVFGFDKTGIVAVNPGENMRQVRLSSPMAYGVVPAFIGDDLIFGGAERPTNNTIYVPSENLFLGLLEGEDKELVVTWPKGKQRMSLHFGEGQGENLIKSVEFDTAGQSFYLAALSAPGIWHKETLTPDYLEKDIKIEWKKPFAAKWKTQLYEEETKTTFAFRPFKGQIWRGVAGSYEYPVWFDGEDAFYHLSKKVQPKGESVIYCLEGRETPLAVLTPADILNQTLGRQAAGGILDYAGRKLRTHHRRGGTGVRRACTCGCTEAIQAVFEAGQEVGQKEYIQGALEDMVYFVQRHVERISEYRKFADGMLKRFEEVRRSSPKLKPLVDSLEDFAQQIPQECDVQKEHMKTLEYADELSKKTIALAAQKDPNNLKAYMELLKAWRDMGGSQDSVVAKCHTITRGLAQAAGYGCAAVPEVVPLAEEIRAACRQTLRNADGYEIWADY